MDDETKQLLMEIRDLQREQVQLLREANFAPWLRMRFSLRSLLLVFTVFAVILGAIAFMANIERRPTIVPVSASP